MKRLISWTKRTLVLTLSLFAITTSGFATNDGDPEMVALLRSVVAEANSECPMTIDETMVMNKMYISNSRVVYDYLVDDETLDGIIFLKERAPEEYENLMLKSMVSGGNEVLFFLALCVEAEYGVEFKISNFKRTNSVKMTLTQYDISGFLSNYDLDEVVEAILSDYL